MGVAWLNLLWGSFSLIKYSHKNVIRIYFIRMTKIAFYTHSGLSQMILNPRVLHHIILLLAPPQKQPVANAPEFNFMNFHDNSLKLSFFLTPFSCLLGLNPYCWEQCIALFFLPPPPPLFCLCWAQVFVRTYYAANLSSWQFKRTFLKPLPNKLHEGIPPIEISTCWIMHRLKSNYLL